MELLLLAREALPHDVLGHAHPPRAPGRAVGQGLVDPAQELAHIIGRPLAVVHGHDDGRAAERAVACGKDLGVLGPHAVPFGGNPVASHQAVAVEMFRFRLLADRRDHHAAVDVVFGALDNHRAPAAVFGVRLAHFGAHAFERQTVALGFDGDLLGVVDELDVFLDGAFKLVLARGDFVRPAPVDHLHGLAAGHPQCRAAGVHGDVAAGRPPPRFPAVPAVRPH